LPNKPILFPGILLLGIPVAGLGMGEADLRDEFTADGSLRVIQVTHSTPFSLT